jgi:hypothetical protein
LVDSSTIDTWRSTTCACPWKEAFGHAGSPRRRVLRFHPEKFITFDRHKLTHD